MSNSRVSNRTSVLAAIALTGSFGLSAGTTAHAAEAASFVVDASGLDLRSSKDVAMLYSKLRYAAETVCGLDEAHSYAPRRQARRCIDGTLDAVVAEVGAKKLRARHYAEMRVLQRSSSDTPVTTTASAATTP
jgi:UrcA family protein